MSEYARVRDWRVTQLRKLPNVDIHLDSQVDEAQVLEFGADHVVIATGATWRRDGTGRRLEDPVPGWQRPSVLTPDDIMDGTMPSRPVVVFDDDHYYMGGIVAEKLRSTGIEVTLVTPANELATWTTNTDQQFRIQQRILRLGIGLKTGISIAEIDEGSATLECIYTGRRNEVEAAAVVMVTSRQPHDELYHSLVGRVAVARIGDCLAPGTIATSVYSGHQYARELDTGPVHVRFRRERAVAP